MQHASFILAANRSPKALSELLPNVVIAEGVFDRVVNSSFHMHMQAKSCRQQPRRGRASSLREGLRRRSETHEPGWGSAWRSGWGIA